jgi:type IV pilus assembly protein PilW
MIELMVSIALGLLVSMAATALLLSSKASYIAQDEGVRLQETGRYAIEAVTRAVRQAAYENWDREAVALVNSSTMTASIAGLDASSLKETEAGIDAPLAKSINGSDVLAVRFVGAGSGANCDETMLNCAGFGVSEPVSMEADRGWSIFYVAADKTGEPELRCKYYGKTSWNTEAIARGIESFQVLYGVDTDADGAPDRFLSAAKIDEMDQTLILDGPNAAARAIDKIRKTYWKKVVVVKVALLVRSAESVRTGAPPNQHDLFGKEYADTYAAVDIGTRINEENLPAATRNRLRKMFSTTIQLRNQATGSGA